MTTVYITGAGSGIGLATANYLEQHAYTVIRHTRDMLDLSKLDQVAKTNLQDIDVLVNNAGINPIIDSKFTDVTSQEIADTINVNLTSPILLTHNFLKQNPNGLVINITSNKVNEIVPFGESCYTVSKRGLSVFNKMMQAEFKHTHRFVEIVVSRIDTDFVKKNSKHYKSRQKEHITDPIEVAKAIKSVIENDVINEITIKNPKR